MDAQVPGTGAQVRPETVPRSGRKQCPGQSGKRNVLVNGLVVAQDWDALVSGTLEHTINVDENSQTQAIRAWTSTLASGEAAPGVDFCDDWTGVLDFDGGTGLPDANDATWSFFENVPCDFELRLYCIEQ